MRRIFLPILSIFLINTTYVLGNTDKNIPIASNCDPIKESLIEKNLWDTYASRKNAFSLNTSKYFDPAGVSVPQKVYQKQKVDSKTTTKKLKDSQETLPLKNNDPLGTIKTVLVEKKTQDQKEEVKQENLAISEKEETQTERVPSILKPIPSIKPKLN